MSLIDVLNAIGEKVLALEQENDRLRAEVTRLSQPKPDRRDDLIRLMAPDIVQAGQTKNRDQWIYEVYDLFCELYPAGMPKEGER